MDSPGRDPLVGRLVAARYRVLARVARGGMATVYRTEDTRLGREIALKVMHQHLAESPAFVDRFRDEARAAASLSHRSVVAVHDQGDDGELVWLAMELLPGRTLRDQLRERGAFSPAEAFEVMEALLLALAEAHRSGLIHRDVKPENVLVARDGSYKVTDFGLARAASTSRTATGSLLGTPEYLAPETAQTGQVDERVDIYAAGVVLFELLTGRQPHTGEVPFQVIWSHVTTDVPAPSLDAPYLPVEVDDVIARACGREPQHRTPSAEAMLAELRRVWSGLHPTVLDARPSADSADSVTGVIPRTRQHSSEGTASRAARVGTATLPDRVRPQPAQRPFDPDVARQPVDPDPAPVAPRQRRGPGFAGVLLVLLLASLGAGAFLWWSEAGPGALRDVPDLRGRTAPAAQQQLGAAGLASTTTPAFDEQVPEGTVLASRPEPGDQVHKNGTVTLVLSAGPELFDVPDLRGSTPAQAGEQLALTGLVVGAVTDAFSDLEAGVVVSSDPVAGEPLRRGTEVALVVSRGPAPVPVPGLGGGSLEEARETLEAVGLELGDSEEQFADAAAGTVIDQDPSGGELPPGSRVDVTLSRGPAPVQVPDVFESRTADAVTALEEAGLDVERRGTRILDRVVGQDPAAGTEVAPGSTVTITTF